MENRVDKCGVFGRLRGGSSGMSGLACLFQNIMNNNTISRFFIMKKLMKGIASSCVMALGLCVFAAEASATSLGEEISKLPEEKPEAESEQGFMNGQMHCVISRMELTRVLSLPDCSFGIESYAAMEGQVLLVIQGTVENKGHAPVHFQTPVFRSAKGKEYDVEDSIRYKTSKSDLFAVKLNPGISHRFVCFYRVPVREVLGGGLVFEKELISFDGDAETVIKLPITNDQKIEQHLLLPEVTNF